MTQKRELEQGRIDEIERAKLLQYINHYAWDQDQIKRAMTTTKLGELRDIIHEIDQWYM